MSQFHWDDDEDEELSESKGLALLLLMLLVLPFAFVYAACVNLGRWVFGGKQAADTSKAEPK